MTLALRSMSWICSLTHQGTCIWAMPRRTRSVMSSPVTGFKRDLTSCTPSGGTHSDFQPRTPRSSAEPILAPGPTRTSKFRRPQCVATHAPSTGIAFFTPQTPSITSGTNGSSLRCIKRVLPTVKILPSTGVLKIRPFLRTSK